MAGGERLAVRRSIRFAVVVATVVASHAYVIRWIDKALDGPPPLLAMANPMFTRLLQQEAPPPVEEAQARTSLQKKGAAITATRVTPRPKRAASSPERAPAPAEPQVVASALTPEASAPTGTSLSPASGLEPAIAAASAAFAASAASPGVSIADSWPADTRVSYKLTGYFRGDLVGDARVQWQRQGERYQARMDLDIGPLRYSFLSQGEVTADSLSPRVFQETSPNRTRVVQLGPEHVVLNDGRSVPRPAGVQDAASQFVEIGHRFATGKAKLVIGGTVPIWLARPAGVDEWFYDIVGREMLSTPQLGTIETFHLKPRPIVNPRGTITAEIWFAPALQYLPVRVRIQMGTEAWADLTVDKIEQR